MASSQDTKNMVLLIWLLTIFFGFIPGLIFYLVKKDDKVILDQSKEALNWSITAIIGYMGCSMMIGAFSFGFSFILAGLMGLALAALGICHLVFCIMGAVASNKQTKFRAPFALRLLK